MADNEVTIKTKIDESGVDKGLKSVKGKVNNAAKDMNKGAKATNTLKTALNETGGAASSFASKMGSVAKSGGAVAAGITAAILAAKKYIETLKQANEAYKVQEKAEKALQKAAENNPYLNRESVQRLKDYASEIQSASNFGDEGTIDVMAQLAASGRSESEIMKLVAAAADYAAAKHISLESAVQNLNKSYGGLAGELGELFPEVKALTAEQLKNGEAVDIIAQKYKGFAQEAADSGTQAKNAFGDFMESVGKIANPFFEALSQKSKSFWEGMTAQMAKFSDALETASRKWGIGGIHRAVNEGVDVINTTYKNATTGEEKRGVDFQTTEYLQWLKEELEWREKLTAEEQAALFEINLELKQRERLAKYEQEQATAEAKKNKENKRQADQLKTEQDKRNELRAAYDETLRQKQEEINQRRINGEEITAEAEAQEMFNTAFSAYIKMMSDPAFKNNSGNYSHEVDARKKIAEWGEIGGKSDLQAQIKELEKDLKDAADEANGVVKNQYDAILETLDAEFKAVIENKYLEEEEKLRIEKEYAEKRAQIVAAKDQEEKNNLDAKLAALTDKDETYYDNYKNKQEEIKKVEEEIQNDAQAKREEILNNKELSEEQEAEALVKLNEETSERMKETDEAYAQNRANFAANLAAQIQAYTAQTVDIINNAANLMLETSKNNAKAEQAALEEKYRKGEISEEEYNEKVTESKKKAAKEQYKIQMVQWSASILQATANIAEGITKAIAQGGVAGLITGPLVAAAGAVQIASIIASKPTPPNFAGGGVIGGMNGASMGADNTYIHARTGEMVVNAAQQKALWEAMNGGANGAGGANIVINNSAANIATAQPKLTRDKIEIMIDARVNDSMRRGRYNQSMSEAQEGMTGDYYGI